MHIAIAFGLGVLGGLINRIRGGFLKIEWFFSSTHLVRAIWSLFFALVVFFGTTSFASIPYLEIGQYRIALIFFTGYMSWVLFGSGAHQHMDFNSWKDSWSKGLLPHDTEIFTQGWLPRLFGGTPNASWSEEKFLTYHIVGKSCEGVLRNLVALSPICIMSPVTYGVYVASGVCWGPLYYLSWIMPSGWPLRGSQAGEVLVGFLSFFILGLFLYR